MIIGRSDRWTLKCQDCRHTRQDTELTTAVKASAHMIKRRHTVHRWRTDEPDIVIEHTPYQGMESLFDEPPF